jgi:ADP-glucose pyrophosphorylase
LAGHSDYVCHEPVSARHGRRHQNIEDLIAEDERIIVYNGDIIANMPIELLIRKHFELKRPLPWRCAQQVRCSMSVLIKMALSATCGIF